MKWIGSDDPTLINDERFAPAGVLAPKSKADFAFVLHALNYLSAKGRAAIVCFEGSQSSNSLNRGNWLSQSTETKLVITV